MSEQAYEAEAEIEIEAEHEETGPDGKPVRVIDRARLTGIAVVPSADPRRRHTPEDQMQRQHHARGR